MRKIRLAAFVTGRYPTVAERSFVYAPMEVAVSVCRGLTERGHRVDYYAPNGSRIDCNLITLGLDSLADFDSRQLPGERCGADLSAEWLWDQSFLEDILRRARRGDYDVLHLHNAPPALTLGRVMTVPTAFTLHNPLRPWLVESLRRLTGPHHHLVSISRSQRVPGQGLPFAATIPNGIDTDHYRFSAQPADALLFAGRICPEKGVRQAVELAQETGHPLDIIGPIADQEYFDRHVQPFLGRDITYRGFVRRDELPAFYGRAKALLNPIQWEEPFGLTMIEAMSCGTPVLALRRGSVPEVVKDGVTGYVFDTVEQMRDLLRRPDPLAALDRADSRRWVEENFGESRMVDRYERLFLAIARSR